MIFFLLRNDGFSIENDHSICVLNSQADISGAALEEFPGILNTKFIILNTKFIILNTKLIILNTKFDLV